MTEWRWKLVLHVIISNQTFTESFASKKKQIIESLRTFTCWWEPQCFASNGQFALLSSKLTCIPMIPSKLYVNRSLQYANLKSFFSKNKKLVNYVSSIISQNTRSNFSISVTKYFFIILGAYVCCICILHCETSYYYVNLSKSNAYDSIISKVKFKFLCFVSAIRTGHSAREEVITVAVHRFISLNSIICENGV